MEDIKKLLKRLYITVIIVIIYGIIFRNKYILIGMGSGCIISIVGLYMLISNVKSISHAKEIKNAKKIAYIGYAQRYSLYFLYLTSIIYFLGVKYFVAAAFGMLSLKFNIYLMKVFEHLKIKNN